MLKRFLLAVVTVAPFCLLSIGSHVLTGGTSTTPSTPGPGAGNYEMTCDATSTYEICIEYSFDTQAEFDSAWNECAYTKNQGHACARTSDAHTCLHTTSTASTCTVTYFPPSDHDSICSQNSGSPNAC